MKLPDLSENISSLVLSLAFQDNEAGYGLFLTELSAWLVAHPQCATLVIYHDNLYSSQNFLSQLHAVLGQGAIRLKVNLEVNPLLADNGLEPTEEYFTAMNQYLAEEQYAWLCLSDSSMDLQDCQRLSIQFHDVLHQKDCQFYPLILEPEVVNDDEDSLSSITEDSFRVEVPVNYLPELTAITPHTTVLALSLDFDGCTDTKESRERLLNYILLILKSYPHITTVKLFINSARQSFYFDFLNAINHAAKGFGDFQSCKVLGTQFQQQLQARAKAELGECAPQIIFEPILMCDVVNRLAAGKTFNCLSQEINRYWASVMTAFTLAHRSGGVDSIVLSTEPPATVLPLNHWHLSYAAGQFQLYFPSSPSPLCLPALVTEKLAQLLTSHGLWQDGPLKDPAALIKAKDAVCMSAIQCIAGNDYVSRLIVENLDGKPVALFNVSGKQYGMADSIVLHDELKTTTVFLHAHVASPMMSEQCALLMFDDRNKDRSFNAKHSKGILNSVTHFYEQNSDLLPSTVRLQCVYFTANHAASVKPPQVGVSIQGLGRHIPEGECREILQRMAKYSPVFVSDEYCKAALLQYVRAPELPDLPISVSHKMNTPPVAVVAGGVASMVMNKPTTVAELSDKVTVSPGASGYLPVLS